MLDVGLADEADLETLVNHPFFSYLSSPMKDALEIKDYYSSDVESARNFCDPNRKNFAFPFDISIGPVGSEEGDYYSIIVVSPDEVKADPNRGKCIVLPFYDSRLLIPIVEAMFDYCLMQPDPKIALRQ
ncbi:MAG: Imm8 family immunity protein [Pseudomonadota bacterium]